MRLRYILGIPGSGKTTRCIDEIIKASQEGRKALYIVPEQFSLESERLLCSAAEGNVVMNSEVISFGHLAHRLLSATGGSGEKILDDNAKTLLLRRIINNLLKEDSLVFYGRSAASTGFADNISALITEFIRCDVAPDTIEEKSVYFADKDRMLSDKLHDIGLIYSGFKADIKDRYIAKDSLLDVLAERIPAAEMLKDTEIWLDSFTDFTPQEFKVAEALLRACVRLNISFCVDTPYFGADIDAFDPYRETKRSINRINRAAKNMGAVIDKSVFLDKDVRHGSAPALGFLTKHYFDGQRCSSPSDEIKTVCASSAREELTYAAGEILSLLRDKKYRCSDIALLISSDSYYRELGNVFDKFGIPYFTDSRRSVLSHPLTEMLRSIFRLLRYGFGCDEVFRLLKTGFNDLTREEIAVAENYCTACAVKNGRWYEKWEYTLSGRYEDKFDLLNDIREYICDILDSIAALRKVKPKTVRSLCEAVYKLFERFGVKERLGMMINDAAAENNEDAVRLHSGVWDTVGDIFSKMCEIMGDDETDTAEFGRLLEAALRNAELGLIPPTCESVTAAHFERSRLPNVKALFMLGVNEGIIPPHHSDTNLLSDSDRMNLSVSGCELGGDSLRLINRDRYNIYTCITKPSERLYISYNTSLESGIRSPLVQDICSCFNKVPIGVKNGEIFADEQAFELLLAHIASLGEEEEVSPLYKAVYAHLYENENYRARLERVSLWLEPPSCENESIGSRLAEKLYLSADDTLVSGITRIQDYESCPYMYFLKYGLKAEEQAEYVPNAADCGTILHNVLKQFSEKVQSETDWESIDENYIRENVDAITAQVTEKYNTAFFDNDASGSFVAERLKKAAVSTIKAFSEKVDGFVPCGYEVTFGPDEDTALPSLKYKLNDSTVLLLTGSIDRVDTFTDKNNDTYVKITDYKTTQKQDLFSEESLFLGIQLQLPLYMQAYTQSSGNVREGGFFYFRIADPVFERVSSDAFAGLISGGAAVDEPSVMEALSDVERKKLSGRSAAFIKIPQEGIKRLTEYVNGMITDAGRSIISGDIKAKPYLFGGRTSCKYCNYSAICCFELCRGGKGRYRSIGRDEAKTLHEKIIGGEDGNAASR